MRLLVQYYQFYHSHCSLLLLFTDQKNDIDAYRYFQELGYHVLAFIILHRCNSLLRNNWYFLVKRLACEEVKQQCIIRNHQLGSRRHGRNLCLDHLLERGPGFHALHTDLVWFSTWDRHTKASNAEVTRVLRLEIARGIRSHASSIEEARRVRILGRSIT